jgi:8-oxo-dGTP diphosphatase
LEFGEDIFDSIKREVLEETGLKIVPKKIIAYTNDIQKAEEKHEVTLYVLSEREDSSQQPEVCMG